MWRYGAPVVLLLAGLLFATGANTAQVELGGGRQEQLSGLVAQESRKVDAYTTQVQRLRSSVDQASRARARDDLRTKRAQRTADRLRKPAGLEPVSGPGVRVTLDDAPRSVGSEENGEVPPDYLVVHQQDVQAVVNAMWAGGATAVQVMDQRLIATSAVRCVGNTLVLQGRVYSPPFTVTAIGPPDAIRAAIDHAPGVRIYKQYVDAYGLGYDVHEVDDVTVPGYTGSLDLHYAHGSH